MRLRPKNEFFRCCQGNGATVEESAESGASGAGPTGRGKSAAPMNTAEDGLPLPQRYWAILTLVTGLVVSVLDSAIANIALPTIAREIGARSEERRVGKEC